LTATRDADTVVIAVGEDAYQTGEGRSQVDIGLKGLQSELLKAVRAVNPKVVVVLMNGRPLVLDWMAANVPVIVESWHLGSEAVYAIADVLFGDYNPSPPAWKYPPGAVIKKLTPQGTLHWRGHLYFVTRALPDEKVWCRQIESRLLIVFRDLMVREIDLAPTVFTVRDGFSPPERIGKLNEVPVAP